MSLDKNNNRTVVRQLSQRSVRTGGRTSLLTILIIALTSMLVAAMVLQATGMVSSQKKQLERAQQVIYMNLTEKQRSNIENDNRISSTIAYKTGQGVEQHGILIKSSYYEPPTEDMTSSLILSEGRMADAMDEVVIDKATLRAFGLPEVLGTQITVPFLNGIPETFTVVGFTDYEADGGKISRHLLYHSLVYADQGTQLAQVPWYLTARVKGGADMNGSALEQLVYKLGEEHGVAYQNINPNDRYIELRTVNPADVLLYMGVAAVLVAISLIVIYSICYLSVSGRVRQFGQLRTIGMTPRQLRRMVKLEGWILWGLGTPLGFIVASTLMLLVGPENGWTLSNNLMALVASAVVCALAVRLGVQKPASLAANVSPIEAARFQDFQREKERTTAARVLTPLGLAKINFSKNLKKQMLTMISLGVGGVLFMAAVIYVDAWDLEAYSRRIEFADSEYAVNFDYNTENSLENGTSALQLQGLLGEPFQAMVRRLPNIERITEYHGVKIRFRWNDVGGNEILTIVERENAAGLQSCLQEGVGAYDALIETGGVYVGVSDIWKSVYGAVPQIGDEIEVSYYNGESHTVRLPVVGIGSGETRDVFPASGMLLIPRETANVLFGDMDTTKMLSVSMQENSHTPAQDEQMRSLLAGYPQLQLLTLTEKMENDADDYAMIRGVLLAVAGVVILFSLVNLLNTLLSGLMARRRQLAMLAALGMTKQQIRSMLNYENLLLAGVNLTVALTLGTLAGWGVCQLMAAFGADYLRFSFPTLWFLLYAMVAMGLPLMITQICLKSFYSESLIERLRITE